jgi:hypothetical protein
MDSLEVELHSRRWGQPEFKVQRELRGDFERIIPLMMDSFDLQENVR